MAQRTPILMLHGTRALLQESSEYETDSEEDEAYGRQLLKPQFVPKAEREVRVRQRVSCAVRHLVKRGIPVNGSCVVALM